MKSKFNNHLLAPLFVFIFSSFIFTSASSQDYLGFANSAYSGVNGIDVNPASIVNSPRLWDITVIGLNVGFGNNYLGFQKRALEHTGKLITGVYPAFSDTDFVVNYFTQRAGGKPVSIFAEANVTLPSFMFTRPKYKDAFAFTCRTRTYANVDGIDPTLAHMFITGVTDSLLFGQKLPSPKLSVQSMVWTEYGITYGKTMKQTNNERLNFAGRIKLLQGIYAAYLYVDKVDLQFNSADTLVVISSHVGYGHSKNLEFNKEALKYNFGGKPSIALDLGMEYEFHPVTTVRSKMSSQSLTTPFQHTYKYKLGFSIQDIGWITYLKPSNARDFTAEFQNIINLKSFQTSGATPLANADDTIQKKFPMISDDDKFKMNLPTVASIQGDYYAGKNIYINSTINYGLQYKNNENKIHEVTTLSITPRWDWDWLGLYIPVSYNKYSHARLGVTTRIGPLIIGMADILPIISKRDVYGMDFHFMLKIPHIQLKKKNKGPRIKSRFDINRPLDKKTKGKAYMPKKDTSPRDQQKKSQKKKSTDNKGRTIYIKL